VDQEYQFVYRLVCAYHPVKLNISNLAKNASTSVDQMERFYVRNMPLSMEG